MSTQVQDFYKATITRNWTATVGDFNVSVAPTVVPGIIVISPQSSSAREIVRYTAVGTNGYGPYVTVSNISDRGLSGTTAQSHIIGENIRMNITAEHWLEMQDDIDSIVAAGLPAGTDGQIMINTAGTWEAGTRLQDSELKTATVLLSSSDILNLHTTPKEIIPAPGVGKIILIDNLLFSFTVGGTQYTSGTTCYFYWGGTSVQLAAAFSSSYITASTDKQIVADCGSANGLLDITDGVNKSVVFSTSSAFTTGTGTAKIFIKYRILTL